MKFTIGKQSIEAQPVSEGTIISEKSGATLRKLTITFTMSGVDVSRQYSAMMQEAKANGIVSGSSDQEEKVLWEVYELDAGYQQQGDEPTQYQVLWELTEKE